MDLKPVNREGLLLNAVDQLMGILETGETILERQILLDVFREKLRFALDEEYPDEQYCTNF